MPSPKFYLYKRSNGYWYVGYMEGGKKCWKSTGERLKQDALKFLTVFEKELKNKAPITLLSEFVTRFKTVQAHTLRESTLKRIYSPAFDAFLAVCGNKALSAYSIKDVETFKHQMLAKASPTYVNILFRSLKAAFNTAIKWELLNENPFVKCDSIKVPQKAPVHFTKAAFSLFLAEVREPALRDVFAFAALTGMRQGEILSLEWRNVDTERKLITIESYGRFLTKTGKLRAIPLSDNALSILIRRRLTGSASSKVFHWKGNPISQSHVEHKFKKYTRMLHLDEGLKFHSLRHTFATWLIQDGVPIYEVQKLLGHSSVRVTEIYSHLVASELHATVNKISIEMN